MTLAVVLVCGFGASSGIRPGAPVAGLVLDAGTGSLRQVMGFPGGAWLSDPLKTGFRIRMAVVAASGKRAAIVRDDDGTVHITWNADGEVMLESIPVLASPDLVAVGAEARRIAVYGGTAHAIETWDESGVRRTEVPEYAGKATSLAVDDGGDGVWLGTETGLYFAGLDGSFRVVAPARAVTAVAACGDGRRAVFGSEGEISVGWSNGWGLSVMTRARPIAGGLVMSASGRHVWIAESEAPRIRAISLETGETLTVLEPRVQPSVFRRSGVALIQITPGGEPLYFIDETNGPSVVFVPGR